MFSRGEDAYQVRNMRGADMSNSGLTGRDLRGAVLFAALIYLAIQFIAQIASVLLVFAITAILVVTLNPAVTWLAMRRFPRPASAGILAILVISVMSVTLYLIIPPAGEQIRELVKQAPGLADQWLQRLRANYPSIGPYLPHEVSISKGTIERLIAVGLGGASRATASAAGAIASSILVFITTIYALASPKPIVDGFLNAFHPTHRARVSKVCSELGGQIRAWAAGVLFAMFAIFVLTWIGLALIGIKEAFLFAVIAGLLEAVPIVGPVLSAVPPIIVALLQNPITALWIGVLFLGIQQLENHILVPMIMSRQLSLHPVTVIFAVMVMGGLFGLVGVFLATPAAATTGILYRELYQSSLNNATHDQ